MKRFALTLCVALACLLAKADGQTLIVTLNDGQRVQFALSTTPEVTIANDQLTITTTETTASYELWKVSTFTYGTGTGIDQATADQKAFTLSGDNIVVDGAATVRIFALDGKAVTLEPTVSGGQTVVSLNGLAKGVYVVNINGKSVKITRR